VRLGDAVAVEHARLAGSQVHGAGPETRVGHRADQHAADVHVLHPPAAHQERREVAATGEHQADAAVRQRRRGTEHQGHELRSPVGRARVDHRGVEHLQEAHRVVLDPAERENRLAQPTRADRGVDALAAHVAEQERRGGPRGAHHVVEVAPDQHALVRRPVRGAQGEARHLRQRRLEQAAAQHPRRAHLPGVERRGGHGDPRALRELLHESGVDGRGDGGRQRVGVPQQDERTGRHAVAGKRHDRADGRGTRPRPALPPRRAVEVVDQQRGVALLAPQRGRDRFGQGRDVGATRAHRAAAVACRPFERPAGHRGPDDHDGVSQLGGGQLDHLLRGPAGMQGQAQATAGRGEEPRPASFGEQVVQPRVLLGDVVDVPGDPAVGQPPSACAQAPPADAELGMRGAVRRGLLGMVRIERTVEQLTDPYVRQQGEGRGVHVADDALVVVGEDAAGAVEQPVRQRARPDRALDLLRAGGGDRPVHVDVVPLLHHRTSPSPGPYDGGFRAPAASVGSGYGIIECGTA
jgi:hypothetical protein